MIFDQVSQSLRSALDSLREEHGRLTNQITQLEKLLADSGAPVRRGPGRPKGSVTKRRGPGRPKGSGKKAAAPAAPPPPMASAAAPVKRGPGRPKGSSNKKKASAPAKESKPAPATPGVRRKPRWSTEAKEQARQRMQAYWAARKAQKPAS